MGKKSTAKYQAAKAAMKDFDAEYTSIVGAIYRLANYSRPEEIEGLKREFELIKPKTPAVLQQCQKAKMAVLDYGEFLAKKTEKYKSMTDSLKKKSLAKHQKRYAKLMPVLQSMDENLHELSRNLMVDFMQMVQKHIGIAAISK